MLAHGDADGEDIEEDMAEDMAEEDIGDVSVAPQTKSLQLKREKVFLIWILKMMPLPHLYNEIKEVLDHGEEDTVMADMEDGEDTEAMEDTGVNPRKVVSTIS